MTYLDALNAAMRRGLKWAMFAFVAAVAISVVVAMATTQEQGESAAETMGTVIGWGLVALLPVAALAALRDMATRRRATVDPVDGTPGGHDAPPQ